jgi:hypothetical protein
MGNRQEEECGGKPLSFTMPEPKVSRQLIPKIIGGSRTAHTGYLYKVKVTFMAATRY